MFVSEILCVPWCKGRFGCFIFTTQRMDPVVWHMSYPWSRARLVKACKFKALSQTCGIGPKELQIDVTVFGWNMLKSRSVLNTVEGIPKVFWCSMFIHVLPPSAAGLVGVGRNHIFHQNNGVLPVLPNMQNCSSKSWLRRTSLLTFYQLTAGTAGLWHLLLTHTSHFLKLSPRSVVDTSSVCWDFGKSWEVRASMGGKKHPETSWNILKAYLEATASYR